MKTRKLTVIMALSLVLAMGVSVFGTIAYLTSTSATLENKFTVGKVNIIVDETKVDEDGEPIYPNGTVIDPVTGEHVDPVTGEPVDPERDTDGNQYRLVPGRAYTKDPTMTVKAVSEDSYVRMEVTFNKADTLKAIMAGQNPAMTVTDILLGNDPAIWVLYNPSGTEDVVNNTLTYEFRYFRTVNTIGAAADLVLEPVFTQFRIPGLITTAQQEALDGLQLDVVGHAIQAEGFDTADAAWAGFAEQVALDDASLPLAP